VVSQGEALLERVFDKLPKYRMQILFGDLNAELGTEDIFKPMIGNESLHKISNDNDDFELGKHKTWFDGECSKFLDHTKQAKLQWLQDPSGINSSQEFYNSSVGIRIFSLDSG
jgi:hypothetical protein